MPLQKTNGGHTNLQIWRGGRSYETQKGAIYQREWNNILFTGAPRASAKENVIQFDIRQSLPHSDRVFDAVFLFHIVEHLTTTEAESFLKEIYRVLKPSGIVRLSTPDLEDICRAYLNRLEEYDDSPSSGNFMKYEWSVLELLDQIARLRHGGLMKDYIRNEHYDPDYARERFGDVFSDFYVPNSRAVKKRMPIKEGIYRFAPRRLLGGVLRRIMGILDAIFLGDNWEDLENFRISGELNKWLYDYFSLTLLLRKTGFCDVSRKTYRTSDIPDWNRFDLDRSTYGDHPIEPSLYMEAYKPPDSALLQSPSRADIFTQP